MTNNELTTAIAWTEEKIKEVDKSTEEAPEIEKRIDEARKILEDLQARVSDVNDLAIARTNGLIILSLRKSINENGDNKSERMLGGMASALFSISKRAATELLKGSFRSLNVEIDTAL